MSRAKVGQIASHLLKAANEPNGVTSEAIEITGLKSGESRIFSGAIGTSTDVDVFKLVGVTAETGVNVEVFAQRLSPASALDSYGRIFDSTGAQLWANDDRANPYSTDSFVSTILRDNSDYYVGISAYGNSSYNVVSGSGLTAAGTTGPYRVKISFS